MRKKHTRAGRVLAILLVFALALGGVGIGGWTAAPAYATESDTIETAMKATLQEYYKAERKGILTDWYEMAAVCASGGDFEHFVLPPTQSDSAAATIFTALMKGDMDAAKTAAATLTQGGTLPVKGDPFNLALDMAAIEAYNRAAENSAESPIPYNKEAAVGALISFQQEDGNFLDVWEPTQISYDNAGMAAVALSLYPDSEAAQTSITKIKTALAAPGAIGVSGAYSSWGTANANTTAVVLWGISAMGEKPDSYKNLSTNKTPVDGLLSFATANGGYGYGAGEATNAYATKQAALAVAEQNNNSSFFTSMTKSSTEYLSVSAQVVAAGDIYAEKDMTITRGKPIDAVIQKALATESAIVYGDYKIYINGQKAESPDTLALQDGDEILAVAAEYEKIAYFKTAPADSMGVNRIAVDFGGSAELTLTEKILADGRESPLMGKPVDGDGANTGNGGSTDAQGMIAVTPIEAREYTVAANRIAWEYDSTAGTSGPVVKIATDTAILPAKVSMMKSSTPQTAKVSVRIEGVSENVLNYTDFTVGNTGTGRLTVYDAVTQALNSKGVTYTASNGYISAIGGVSATTGGEGNDGSGWDGWGYNIVAPKYLDGREYVTGMANQFISGGEEILVYYTNTTFTTEYVFVSSTLESDGSVTIGLSSYQSKPPSYEMKLAPVAGVEVLWGAGTENAYTSKSGIDGKVTILAEKAPLGTHSLQIKKVGTYGLPDVIRLAPGYTVAVSNSGASGDQGINPLEKKVFLTVKGPSGNLKNKTAYQWYSGITPLALLQSSGLSIELTGSGNYVSKIEGIGEFDLGANSGWLYSVNGATPSTTASNGYSLAEDDTVLWYYTKDYTKDPSSSGWTKDEETTVEGNTASATVTAEAKTDAKGNATAAVDSKAVSAAIADAVKAADKKGEGTKAEVVLSIKADSKATSVEATIPKESIAELDKKVDVMTVSTPMGDISLDGAALKTVAGQATAPVKVKVAKAGEIQDRSTFKLTITSGDKEISQLNGKARISLPYVADSGETAASLVIYHVDDQGGKEQVKKSKYNEKTKKMEYVTRHLSTYMIGYNQVSFDDTASHWAKEQIDYLAAREILRGMTETAFEPDGQITRAQFAQILANLAEADLTKYGKDIAGGFNDVKPEAWYAGPVAWAAEQGIATGTKNKDGSASFDPDANITRQDMAVMLERYAAKVENGELAKTNKEIAFADTASIGGYAKEAVSKMQQAGILGGKPQKDIGGKEQTVFAPKDNATRAEAAKMLAILMQSGI